MRANPRKRIWIVMGALMLLCGVMLFISRDASWAQRKFERKGCLDCHKKFSDKYLSMKSVHLPVKEGKCEDCHLRHGIVPKMLLKKEGEEICFSCHAKEKLGMNRSKVHTALKSGKCSQCHNPHAGPDPISSRRKVPGSATSATRRRALRGRRFTRSSRRTVAGPVISPTVRTRTIF